MNKLLTLLPELFISLIQVILNLSEWQEINDVHLITLSESFLKENVHQKIFEEFPFLLAETVPPRILQPEVFAEFEQLYLQIEKEYFSSSTYRTRMIGNLFVLLLKIKEYFWEDYNPIYGGNRSSQIVKQFKRTLEQHYRDLVSGKADKVFRVQDYADAQHLHPNYLSNVIKSKTGKPIGTWITEKTITGSPHVATTFSCVYQTNCSSAGLYRIHSFQ